MIHNMIYKMLHKEILVYRYLSKYELDKILQGEIDKIGFEYAGQNVSNSHHYKLNRKYIHFFKNEVDMEYIRAYYRDHYISFYEENEFYRVCFKIPRCRLMLTKGYGVYHTLHGYDSLTVKVPEYAMDIKHFKSEWLVSYELDVKNDSCNIK